MAIARDAFAITQGFCKRLAQRDTDIFDAVVVINMYIAIAVDVKIEQPMTSNLFQHVLEERHFGVEPTLTLAIERKLHGNTGFQRLALDFGFTI